MQKHIMKNPLSIAVKLSSFLCLITLFIACKSIKLEKVYTHHLKQAPPAGVKIKNNFYCDYQEINNLDWMEYMYWVNRVYGKNSDEYLSVLPDTNVWSNEDQCIESLDTFYLRHPAYKNCPVVGISQKQAIEYSKWRSERVLEQILVSNGVIAADSSYKFTMERFYNGSFELLDPTIDKSKVYYPEFRLPTFNERQIILQFTDSVQQAYYGNCNRKKCKTCISYLNTVRCGIDPCVFYPEERLKEPSYDCYKDLIIHYLRGNANEWSAHEHIAFGGGWNTPKALALQQDTFHITKPDASTGFRNVCEWKKWEY